ncbi:MAG: cysteine hydrolase [Rhodospirillales bacterium]|jgi:hypothetical protein|nr:cysteine hydrolase [Rhodospirillales bacterium]
MDGSTSADSRCGRNQEKTIWHRDRGFDCLLVEDAAESYFTQFKATTLAMVRAQGAIVGWTARVDQVVAAL